LLIRAFASSTTFLHMPDHPDLAQHFMYLLNWDWSDVARLKRSIEIIRDSGNPILKKTLAKIVADLERDTSKRAELPAHHRPIIAVDANGQALTGWLAEMYIDTLPYDRATHR
jgi:hypothetical protein